MENSKIVVDKKIDVNLGWEKISMVDFLNDVEKLKGLGVDYLEIGCYLDEYNNKNITIEAFKTEMETDEEFERRINNRKKVDDMNRERRYLEFLRLQKEFEKYGK